MSSFRPHRVLLAAALAASSCFGSIGRSVESNGSRPIAVELKDPWSASDLVEAPALAKSLSGAEQPVVLCVGVAMLYRSSHIPGALYAGPASDSAGLQVLKDKVRNLPRNQAIVIYCGCCPWTHCPNIRPAYRTLHDLGFRNVRVLVIQGNFHDDWVAKGFPIDKSSGN